MNSDAIQQYAFLKSGLSQIWRKYDEERKAFLGEHGFTKATLEELESEVIASLNGGTVKTEFGTLQSVPKDIYTHKESRKIGERHTVHYTPIKE